MATKTKKRTDVLARFERQHLYSPREAVDLLKDVASASFDETVELAVRLGVDPRKADQIVRGNVSLPGGTGQTVRVAVFAAGAAAQEARDAGADVVGADDLVERVQGGFVDFDGAIATPDMMGMVGRVARILGPRRLMPNPKDGTVTTDVAKAVSEMKGGKVTFRTDKFGIIHVAIGKVSFDRKALLDNMYAVIDELQRSKPAAAKGRYIRSITVTTTMGPGVKVDPGRLKDIDDRDAAAS